MSSINGVRNLRILNFSKKATILKNLKKWGRKCGLAPPFIHTTAYLLKELIAHSKYLIPLLYLLNDCISAKSTP